RIGDGVVSRQGEPVRPLLGELLVTEGKSRLRDGGSRVRGNRRPGVPTRITQRLRRSEQPRRVDRSSPPVGQRCHRLEGVGESGTIAGLVSKVESLVIKSGGPFD